MDTLLAPFGGSAELALQHALAVQQRTTELMVAHTQALLLLQQVRSRRRA